MNNGEILVSRGQIIEQLVVSSLVGNIRVGQRLAGWITYEND